MEPNTGYRSPLETRNASEQMRAIWSPQRKFSTWRRVWLAVAEAQHELGLDISEKQLTEIRDHLDTIDFKAAAAYEHKLRHDVMAHVHTLGDAAPSARPILHLGCTSQDIVCNADLILLRESLELIALKLARVIDALATFAQQYRELPTLGFTHYQPAQPTTVGKRATLWAQDFVIALREIEHRLETLGLRGVRGATGTQASFLRLFDGDENKVQQFDELICEKLNWPLEKRIAVTGQTYPRLVDAQIVNALAVAAAAVHKTCNDLRLLANRKEIEEPFESGQIGSSAMAYKRNPMRCERATGLARFVMAMAQNPLNTAATQWFERTLDDSANRRLSLPEPFLALDGCFEIMHNVTSGLVVYEKTISANLMSELPFMASENIMLAATASGADRQDAHELLRRHSRAAAEQVKQAGGRNDLIERLRSEAMFQEIDLDAVLDPNDYIGLAPQQTETFIEQVITPIRQRYADELNIRSDLRV